MALHFLLTQKFCASYHFIDGAESKPGHDLANFFGDSIEIVDDIFGLSFEFSTKPFVECCDTNRAVVQMALAHINTSHRNQRGSAEVIFFSAEECGVDNVFSGAHAAIGSQGHSIAKLIEQ